MAASLRPAAAMGMRPSSSMAVARPVFRASGLVAPVRGRRAALAVVRAAAEQQQAAAAPAAGPGSEIVPDSEFSLSKISFGSILTPLGLGLLFYGFGAYFTLLPGADLSSIMLIYGFPISLLGFALSYAQLEPVGCKTTRAALELRSAQMTDIQKQIREDVTRFRYGDEQHLEEALDKVFRFGKQGGVPRKSAPLLTGLREEVEEGRYTLVLEFESSLDWAVWEERLPKIESFFGPGIEARLGQTEKGVDVLLISDGSGKGRGGKEKADVLPPLMPGLAPRKQQ